MKESVARPTVRSTERRRNSSALLDGAALAEQLDVSERFVRRMVSERRIPFRKIGRFVRFHPDDIDKWLEAQRVETAERY
jgi:excisionase family DNA binding protein